MRSGVANPRLNREEELTKRKYNSSLTGHDKNSEQITYQKDWSKLQSIRQRTKEIDHGTEAVLGSEKESVLTAGGADSERVQNKQKEGRFGPSIYSKGFNESKNKNSTVVGIQERNRLHDIYGSELKQIQLSSAKSNAIVPMATSFRKRQALLNEKLIGLTNKSMTQGQSAKVRDDMPTLVKGLLDYLPSSNKKPSQSFNKESAPFSVDHLNLNSASLIVANDTSDYSGYNIQQYEPKKSSISNNWRVMVPTLNDNIDTLNPPARSISQKVDKQSQLGASVLQSKHGSMVDQIENRRLANTIKIGNSTNRGNNVFANLLPQYAQQKFGFSEETQRSVNAGNQPIAASNLTKAKKSPGPHKTQLFNDGTQILALSKRSKTKDNVGKQEPDSRESPQFGGSCEQRAKSNLDVNSRPNDKLAVLAISTDNQGQKARVAQGSTKRGQKSPYGQILPSLNIKMEINRHAAISTNRNNHHKKHQPEQVAMTYRSHSTAVNASLVGISRPNSGQMINDYSSNLVPEKQQSFQQKTESIERSEIDQQLLDSRDLMMSNSKPIQLQPVMANSIQPRPPQVSTSGFEKVADGSALNMGSLPIASMTFSSGKQPSGLYLKPQGMTQNQQIIVNSGGTSNGITAVGSYGPWSPSKTTKPNATNSIIAVSKADLIEQLSPMKTFMVERNAQKHALQGFSEYMNSGTQQSENRNDMRTPLHQQIGGTEPRNGKLPTSEIPKVNVPELKQPNAHSRMLQSNKTRQIMRTHQMSAQKMGLNEQRNNYLAPNQLGSRNSPLNKQIEESSYLKTVAAQANPVASSMAPDSTILALEKSLRPHKFNLQQAQAIPQQPQIKQSLPFGKHQRQPFIFDNNEPVQTPQQTISAKVPYQQKPLSEVRPYNKLSQLEKGNVFDVNATKHMKNKEQQHVLGEQLTQALHFAYQGDYQPKSSFAPAPQPITTKPQNNYTKLKRSSDFTATKKSDSAVSQSQSGIPPVIFAQEVVTSVRKSMEKSNCAPSMCLPTYTAQASSTANVNVGAIVGKAAAILEAFSPRKSTRASQSLQSGAEHKVDEIKEDIKIGCEVGNHENDDQMRRNLTEAKGDEEENVPSHLSLNHSEDNLNHQSSIVESVADQSEINFKQNSVGPSLLKTKKSNRKSIGVFSKGGRRNKRKGTTRSVISSKPSLHSNYSRAVHVQEKGIQDHKFVKDARRVENYYQAKGVKEDEFSNKMAVNILSDHHSSYGGSRQGKRLKTMRKDSTSMGTTNLQGTKSQQKIHMARPSRVSQRSSSAVRTPASKALYSSSTNKEYIKQAAVPGSNASQGGRKTVTKAISAFSVNEQSHSSLLPNQITVPGAESTSQAANAKIVKPEEPKIIQSNVEQDINLLTQSIIVEDKSSVRDQTSCQLENLELKSQTEVAAKQVAESKKEVGANKADGQHTSQLFKNNHHLVINKKDVTKPTQNQSTGHGKQEVKVTSNKTNFKASQVNRVRQIQNSQKTLELKTREQETVTLNVNKGGGVTRGRLIEQSNIAVKEPQSAAKVMPHKNKLQTAFSMMSRCSSVTKTLNNEASQSQISECDTKIPFQKETSRQSLKTDGQEVLTDRAVSIIKSYDQKTQAIDEENEELDKERPVLSNQQRKDKNKVHKQVVSAYQGRESILNAQTSSPYCTMSTVLETSPVKQQEMQTTQFQQTDQLRLMNTLAPKPGSSMNQGQAGKSFQNDDDYIPAASNTPYTSCKSFVIIDSHHSKVLQSKNKDEVREMASLTKMMTAIVCLELAQELKFDIKNTYFKVSLNASRTTGTTACLVDGQVVSIWDLLHGLMLPSGNDAAMVLAENFTERLLKKSNRSQTANSAADQNKAIRAPDSGVREFVKRMNKTARSCHMRATNYANPHGLADKSNHSTAVELAYLANYAMKNDMFSQIVNTKTFYSINFMPVKRSKKLPNFEYETWTQYEESDIPFAHGEVQYVQYHQTWYNSNKLLDQPGFCGVKTGQTSTAGACLAIFYRNTVINKNLITVVLGSKNVEYRWKDTRRLTLWADAILMEDHQMKNYSPIKSLKKQTLPLFRT